MDNTAELFNNNKIEKFLVPKKLWVAPMLIPLADAGNINGTVGPGSDLGQPVPPSGS